jgi:hypothetical protein
VQKRLELTREVLQPKNGFTGSEQQDYSRKISTTLKGCQVPEGRGKFIVQIVIP